MLRIFIGYDSREPVAYHTLAHSIITRATVPVSIAPVARHLVHGAFTRLRGPLESTDFSLSRFLVPYLVDYRGWAIFMDCDMLCLADVAELMGHVRQPLGKAVFVCPHDYTPKQMTKFLGQTQTVYPRKNWSSLMVFWAGHTACQRLTLEYVNQASPLDLHRFAWVSDEGQIGTLPLEWNYLVGEPNQAQEPPKLVHFTNGGPWFEEYRDCEYADRWRAEQQRMVGVG